jgi:uncharacterized protein (DUF1800 family)
LPTAIEASRFLQQMSFGPNEAEIAAVQSKGFRQYLLDQFSAPASTYASGGSDEINTTMEKDFCNAKFPQGGTARDNCWRDWYSSEPLKWDFFRQAVENPDQLRQRMAHALAQIVVVSDRETEGTYGMREYYQMLRNNAFGNYRTILREVTLSPLMGDYLDMVNNEAAAPNENFARELLQLFSIGVCELNLDGTLKGGKCTATYDNTTVRNYSYALTGWTYPAGGKNPWCNNGVCGGWQNNAYYRGRMVSVAAQHDKTERVLLSGTTVPASRTPDQALNSVLDSVMNHPNTAPFISKQLIQFFVTSNPSPGYVSRVATVFNSGTFDGITGGTGKGDLRAVIAAILLDPEARDMNRMTDASFGKLREPILYMTGALRAFGGITDGVPLGRWWFGDAMGQSVFSSPSVFNYYPPDYPLPGNAGLLAPQFGIAGASTVMGRSNFANSLFMWWYNKGGTYAPDATVFSGRGTRVNYSLFEADAVDAGKLVDRLNLLLLNGRLSAQDRAQVVTAVETWTTNENSWLTRTDIASNYQRERIKQAAYILLSSPQYQVQR